MRLRSHYLLLAFSIVVPIAVFCGIAIKMLQEAHHDSAIGRIVEAASTTAQAIDAEIDRAQAVLKVLGSSHALANGNLEQFHEEASLASAGPGGWIILYDTEGKQLVNTRRPFGEPLSVRPDPEEVASMLASGRGQVSNMRWGSVLKNHFVMVETPIVARDGRRYIIGQAFSPDYFAHTFSRHPLPASWRISILDRSGVIIARSSKANEFVGRSARPATLAVLNNSRSGVLRHPSGEDLEVYDAFTRSERAGWPVIIGAPVEEINGAVWRGVSVISVGLVVALLAALTLAVLAGRHVVRFVAGASEAAAELGRGGVPTTLASSGINELETLNDAIREASERLQTEMAQRGAAEQERNALLILEQEARLRAERQNTAKDEFMAMLGHELRNPLSAVASAVEILERGDAVEAGAAARAREVLRRQTGHLRKMVDDLLEVNRALMGKLKLDNVPVDLADIVRRSIDTLHASGRTAGFDLRLDAEPSIVMADPARLMQILDNVLDNAIKYSPNGGAIEVRLRHDGDDVLLTVHDHGQGIPPDLLPTVFEMFVQGAQPLQRAAGGLGIGLSLVRRLVELQRGSVSIASPGAGQGTTVSIRLPRQKDMVSVPRTVQLAPVERRRHVLLVEDNADAREMMAMLLELHGCAVHAAVDGPQGIDVARAARPELAFIDIGLPGMDGYQLARALKSDPQTAHMELIALTGYGSESDRHRAREAGFARHFTKPIKLEDLQLALS